MATLGWKDYVDYMLTRGNIENFMIVSSVDASHWASTPDFMLREYVGTIVYEDGSEKDETINEAVSILQLISRGPRPFHGLRMNGGKKQQIIQTIVDEETNITIIYGKYAKGGSCVAEGGKCIVIGTYNEQKGHTASGCYENVTELAKYFLRAKWPTAELVQRTPQRPAYNSPEASWAPYIDELLIGRGNIAHALICSNVDGTIYTASPNFTLKTYHADIPQEDGTEISEVVNEVDNLLKLMKGTKPPQGLRLNGEKKYQILKSFVDEVTNTYVVYGKKTRGGCCVGVSGSVIVVGVYDEGLGHTSTGCNAVVSDLVAYLLKEGK